MIPRMQLLNETIDKLKAMNPNIYKLHDGKRHSDVVS